MASGDRYQSFPHTPDPSPGVPGREVVIGAAGVRVQSHEVLEVADLPPHPLLRQPQGWVKQKPSFSPTYVRRQTTAPFSVFFCVFFCFFMLYGVVVQFDHNVFEKEKSGSNHGWTIPKTMLLLKVESRK